MDSATRPQQTAPAPPSLLWRLFVHKSKIAWSKVLTSRYLKANIVNLLYAIIMIVMDVAVYSNELEGLVYLLLAIIHCINAYMYLWVWRGEHQNIFTLFCLPDWLNGVCAAFYLGTGFCAPYMYDDGGSPTDIFVQVRRIELFLSVLECIAVVGWLYQWYACFVTDLRLRPKQCRGRGWTLDDPDMWANISLVIAAAYYILYNIIICIDHYKYYETSTLYFWGDFWYLINALCYILCALRDCDCFWFMPLSGHLPDFDAMAEESGLVSSGSSGFDDRTSQDDGGDVEVALPRGLSSRALSRLRSSSGEMSEGAAILSEADEALPLLGTEEQKRLH